MTAPVTCPICGRPAVRVIESEDGLHQGTVPFQHIKCVFDALGRTCKTCRFDVCDVYETVEFNRPDLIDQGKFGCTIWEAKP